MSGAQERRRGRDEERQLDNARRAQRRQRAKLERDDEFLPGAADDDWDVGDGSVRRHVPAPEPLGDVLGGIVRAKGWEQRLLTTNVLRRWPQIVGEAVAAHTRPVRLAGGILVVAAQDTTWATQVGWLVEQIRDQVNAHLPEAQAVRRVDVVVDRERG